MLAAIFIAVVWPREREPVYKGKKLSQWILQSRQTRYPETVPPTATQARDAVQHIGTNGIPFLLRWMQYEPSPWRQKIDNKMRGYPGRTWDNFITRTILRDRRNERAGLGATGFELLGTNGVLALPELVKRMADQKAPYTAWRSARALAYLGVSALPPLLVEATNRNNSHRSFILQALGTMKYLGTDAALAIPVLIECANDTNWPVSVFAARSLGQLQLEPEIVLPALARLVSSNGMLRGIAIQSIGMFGKQPTNPALPVVMAALNDSDLRYREVATNVLRQIAPEVLPKEKGTGKLEGSKER